MLAIRDQRLPPAALHDVARRFGLFSGNPVHAPIDAYDDVVRFVREPEDTGRVIGEEWHMDLPWMEKPPGNEKTDEGRASGPLSSTSVASRMPTRH